MPNKINNKNLLKILNQFQNGLEKDQSTIESQLLLQYKKSLDQIKIEMGRIYERYGTQIAEKSFTNLGRLKNIRAQITDNIKQILKDQHGYDYELTKNSIRDFYSSTFNNTVGALEQTVGVRLNFSLLSEDAILAAIKNPYDKIGWGKRTVENINDLNASVKTEITQGIIQGRTYAQTANRLNEQLNIGATKALRIVRTETHGAQNQGRLDGFGKTEESAKLLGIEVERVWQHNSRRNPREAHIKMNGKVADKNGEFTFISGNNAGSQTAGPGLSGIAEEDINCACTVIMRIKNL